MPTFASAWISSPYPPTPPPNCCARYYHRHHHHISCTKNIYILSLSLPLSLCSGRRLYAPSFFFLFFPSFPIKNVLFFFSFACFFFLLKDSPHGGKPSFYFVFS